MRNNNGNIFSGQGVLIAFLLVITVAVFVSGYGIMFSGSGSGSVADPYVITNCTQLQEVNDDLNANYSLGTNIDCSDTPNWNSGEGFIPLSGIGEGANAFTGRFFGNNYNISDLFIDRVQDNVGLFGKSFTGAADYGRVYDVGLDNANITGQNNVGGLIGYGSYSIVNNSHFSGQIQGTNIVGGLVGYSYYGNIDNSYSTGNINGNGKVGGLIGFLYSGTINNSYSNANITGTGNNLGGLIGYARSATINNSYSNGIVRGSGYTYSFYPYSTVDNSYIGGLAGYANGGIIENSYAAGDVLAAGYGGGSNIGGLIGYARSATINNSYSMGNVNGSGDDYTGGLVGRTSYGTIDNSYSNANVNGEDYIGGLVGRTSYGTIDNSYSNANITGTGNYVGGLVGYLEGNKINNSHASGSVSGSSYVGGLVGRFNYDYYGNIDNSYSNANITGTGNYVGGLVGYADSSTTIRNSSATGNVSGIGHPSSYYPYSTVDNSYLGGLVGYTNSMNIYNSHATGDVLAAGYGGGEYFGGLVGYANNGIIEESYSTGNVNGTSDNSIGGLVGYGNYVTINKTHATGSVTSSGNQVGGLVGYASYGTIDNSYATGNVNGSQNVGGLVGYHNNNVINNSYATGDVNGTYIVGGLVGRTYYGTIDNSYATGDVYDIADFTGGLAGYQDSGSIERSYATGNIVGVDYVGGLVGNAVVVGSNTLTINNSYARGNVTGVNKVGGLVGRAIGASSYLYAYYATIDNSYATGDVIGSENYAGGLVGELYIANVDNSYSTGNVSGASYTGGLVGYGGYGYFYSNIDNSYWHNRSQGLNCASGGNFGILTCIAVDSISYFYNVSNPPMDSWDFVSVWDSVQDLLGFPILRFQGMGGDITVPLVQFVRPTESNNSFLSADFILVNVTATDTNLANITIRLFNSTALVNETTTTTSPNFANFSNLESGVYYINATATDASNNKNITETRKITLVGSDVVVATNESVTVNSTQTQIVTNNLTNLQNITILSSVLSNQTVTLDLSQFLTSGNVTTSVNNLTFTRADNSSTGINYVVIIPSNTTISGGSGWDGLIKLPTINTSSFSAPSSGTANVVIDLGSTVELNFSSPVKIVIGGMAGKKAAWSRGNTTLTGISTVCDSATAPTNLNNSDSTKRECYIDSGSDLVIWTYHFTSFAAYTSAATTTTTTSGGSSSGGGGTAGHTTTTYIPTEEQITAGYVKELSTNEAVKFSVAGETHSVSIIELTGESVTIDVASAPQRATIKVGETKKFDVNNDRYYDIKVTLNSITAGKANLTLASIHEKSEVVVPSAFISRTENETAPEEVNLPYPLKSEVNFSTKLIILLATLIIIIIIIMRARADYLMMEEHRVKQFASELRRGIVFKLLSALGFRRQVYARPRYKLD